MRLVMSLLLNLLTELRGLHFLVSDSMDGSNFKSIINEKTCCQRVFF